MLTDALDKIAPAEGMTVSGNRWAPEAAGAPRRVPSAAEFVARAEALVPALRERAAKAERDRRLPDVTIEEFRAAEFHKIMQPVQFGGYGLGMDAGAEVIRTLATGCGSSAWVAHLFIMHSWMVGLFPTAAQQDYWGAGADVMCSTSAFAVRSSMEKVDGGFRLTGRWKFASGSDFADWFIILRPTPECADWFLVPRADLTISDDWHVSGLCATGSQDLILEDVFVPAHRVLDYMGFVEGKRFGRLAIAQQALWGIPAALLGMATGAVEAFRQSLLGKRASVAGEAQIERPSNQIKLAEAMTEIHAAELIMRHRMAKLNEIGWSSEEGDAEVYASERDAAYVARIAAKITHDLVLLAGSNAAYLTNPIQRFHRDILVGATHVSVVWEEIAEAYGRALWELPRKGR